ncbi:Trk system potassium transporter TrkA [Chromatium okenii]|uniref:Trk system potassium uptake protein TrkA n=1 Tax=Chromatium okenii TaxID=61644 RepID=A0A2S7XT29_9GAMM|nr:Trk system potassium transporter TrkA [Chromatium okenii]MBV5308650.1 Trk system potassium transporter TrkA [Chromatium okenii]PQJ96703.1 Trk system potassium transporter TrkA [Chromatium okenii]
MKIIILGAGQVGSSVAESLVSEANEINVIDTDTRRLRQLQNRLDLRTVIGNAALPSVLRQAGAEDTDLLIAVTQSDQTNLCACRTADTLFKIPTKIARLRSADYSRHPELLDAKNFAVDFSICPEQIVTDYLLKLIEFPEALQVLEFADGMVSLVAARAVEGGPLVGHPVSDLRRHMPEIDARIAAIYRRDQPIMPDGNTRIEAGDEVFYLAATRDMRQVMTELRQSDQPTRRIMIAGGGNIGSRLAEVAQERYQVKVIESQEQRARELGSLLDRALVLAGDATDENLLIAENIDDMDFFLALTNDDENNIMAALLAKNLGARRVLALINRRAYADLLQADRIDIAISPAQVSIGSLLAHVRRGDVAAVHSLRRGAAEALEFVVHGDASTSRVIGRHISELELPRGASIGAIVRGVSQDTPGASLHLGQVLIAHGDTLIEPEDHVILFLASKSLVPKVERYFQVGLAFF